jgi:PAS domain S-box-containing protein
MFRGFDLFFALFNNLAIFIALVVVYSYLFSKLRGTKWYHRQIATGLSFAVFAIACMSAKIPVFSGVIVDQRNAIVTLSTVFGGPLSGFLSAVFAGGFRLYLGGEGAFSGLIGVLLATVAGLVIRRLPWKFLSVWNAVRSAALASIIILPGFLFVGNLATGWELMKGMSLPFGTAIFIGIFFGGLLLQRQEERDLVELLLGQSEQKYRELVESTQDLITNTDSEGVFTFVNHVAIEILGRKPADCVGVSALDFVHPNDKEETLKWFRDCVSRNISQGQIENRQVNSQTGKIHTVLWSSTFHYDQTGHCLGVGNIARDVTEHRQAEHFLKESEVRYRSLFENVPDGILIADKNGVYLDANPAICRMLGYLKEELIGMNGTDIVSPVEVGKVEPALEEILIHTEYSSEWQFQRKDATSFSAEVIVTTMPDGSLLATVRDITRRKELEAELLQAQKIESIGKLAGGIAHDFNNILVPIIGYVELAMMELGTEDKIYQDLLGVHKAAERAAGLTRQILAFSRKQMLEMRVQDLNEIVGDFQTMIQRLIGEDIELQACLDPSVDNVLVDKGQIEQILLNLVVNARDAMPAGGKLTIETSNVYLDEGYMKSHADLKRPGAYVMLAITDNGCGMDESFQRKIFEPFFTTKEKGQGTGLGLATVFGIVKQHNGHIMVYSELGQGTSFKVYLPKTDNHKTKIEDLPEPLSLLGTETILVAEDEDVVRDFVCETLVTHGYKVIESVTAGQCLQLAKEADQPIHLLLTDVIMPEMNGRELYSRLQEISPATRVLFMSGYTDNVVVHHGVLEEGVNFLQKPFTIQDLAKKLRTILDKKIPG